MSEKIAVLGAGSWGTAISALLIRNSHQVRLWTIDSDVAEEITKNHTNSKFFPEVKLPESLTCSTSLAETLHEASLVVLAIPSSALKEVAGELKDYAPGARIVSLTKGLDGRSLMRPSELVEEVLDNGQDVYVLSGPSFAKEVLNQRPTAVCLAGAELEKTRELAKVFHTEFFRVYLTDDRKGVEFGGAFKNVIALAVGVSDGLELGLNARAALLTRGLAEIARLSISLGAKPETLFGLSGMGDLFLTATGELSRNRRVGIALAQGKTLPEILADLGQVAEGVETAERMLQLARRQKVEVPICQEVVSVLRGEKQVEQALKNLVNRELKAEH